LKDDGICILILPWKEGTFDHRRPISSFTKLLENYVTNRDERYIDDYLPEIKEFYDLSRDKPAGNMEQFLHLLPFKMSDFYTLYFLYFLTLFFLI
jgi:hypothetical protein